MSYMFGVFYQGGAVDQKDRMVLINHNGTEGGSSVFGVNCGEGVVGILHQQYVGGWKGCIEFFQGVRGVEFCLGRKVGCEGVFRCRQVQVIT